MTTLNVNDLAGLGIKVDIPNKDEEKNQVKLINKKTGVEKPIYDPIAVRLKVENDLKPLFIEARKTGKWFKTSASDKYFSPDELAELQAQNHFIWGRVHWELVDPQEYIDILEFNIRMENEKLREVREIIREHNKYLDSSYVSDLDSYKEIEEIANNFGDNITENNLKETQDNNHKIVTRLEESLTPKSENFKPEFYAKGQRRISVPLTLQKQTPLNFIKHNGIEYHNVDDFQVISKENGEVYKKGNILPKGEYVIEIYVEE